jgi:hypothetical protein
VIGWDGMGWNGMHSIDFHAIHEKGRISTEVNLSIVCERMKEKSEHEEQVQE